MGQRRRYVPQRLPAKLLQIRRGLGLSQSQLAKLIDVGISTARVCEYEKATREPSLLTLLAYAYLVGISTDDLIDDGVELPEQIRIRRRRKKITLV